MAVHGAGRPRHRSAQEISFGALLDVLPGVGPEEATADLAHLCDAIAALEREGPRQLLLVDEAHLLDDASATAVHCIATGDRVRVVVTVRTGEIAPDTATAL